MTLRRKLLLAAAAVLLIVTTILGSYLAAARTQRNSAQITELQRTEQEIRQVLGIVQQATGKPAQQAQAAAIAGLIRCLYNRIDADTGHAPLDASCTRLADQRP